MLNVKNNDDPPEFVFRSGRKYISYSYYALSILIYDPKTPYLKGDDTRLYPRNKNGIKVIEKISRIVSWVDNHKGTICLQYETHFPYSLRKLTLLSENSIDKKVIEFHDPIDNRFSLSVMNGIFQRVKDRSGKKCQLPHNCLFHVNPNDYNVDRLYVSKELVEQIPKYHMSIAEFEDLEVNKKWKTCRFVKIKCPKGDYINFTVRKENVLVLLEFESPEIVIEYLEEYMEDMEYTRNEVLMRIGCYLRSRIPLDQYDQVEKLWKNA